MTVIQRVVKSSVHGRLKTCHMSDVRYAKLVHDKVADTER